MGQRLTRTGIGLAIVFVFVVIAVLYVRFGTRLTKPEPENTSVSTVNAVSDAAQNAAPRFDNEETETPAPTPTPVPSEETLAEPIAQFKERITKKFFGTYITPSNSPVQPERFTGYHTGVDVEYTDTNEDVPVFALDSGQVVYSQTVSGYGGVFILEFNFKDETYTALYGHIRPSRLPSIGASVIKGDQVAVLGSGESTETDGERQHLHLSIHKGSSTSVKGYVQSQSELSGWVDPLSLYP